MIIEVSPGTAEDLYISVPLLHWSIRLYFVWIRDTLPN